MDPKMDSGVRDPNEFEELFDITRIISPQETIGIIDDLICHEVRFYLA